MTTANCDWRSLGFLILLLPLGGCSAPAGGIVEPATSPATTQVRGPATGFSADIRSTPDRRGYHAPIRGSAADSWTALPEIFEGLGINAGVLSEANRSYGNRTLRIRRRLAGERPSTFVSCGQVPSGGGPAADAYLLELSIVAAVASRGPREATMLVTVEGQATPPTGNVRYPCVSTGVLEQLIFKALEERLAGE
jgi:hypothetical protein